MPPSRSELEAMADELGITGGERAAFIGDVVPVPRPKASPAASAAATTNASRVMSKTDAFLGASPSATSSGVTTTVNRSVGDPGVFVGPETPRGTLNPAPRAPGVGPRVAAGMEPLPSPLMAKVAGVAGGVASKVYDARMALAGETPVLRDRVEDIAGFNRVMDNVESARAADVQARRAVEPARQAEMTRVEAENARKATTGASPPHASKSEPATVPQPATATKPTDQPVTAPPVVTLQQAIDGLRSMNVPQAAIEAELKKGEDGQRNVIDAYRNRTEK